jgi:hypothetical protein
MCKRKNRSLREWRSGSHTTTPQILFEPKPFTFFFLRFVKRKEAKSGETTVHLFVEPHKSYAARFDDKVFGATVTLGQEGN